MQCEWEPDGSNWEPPIGWAERLVTGAVGSSHAVDA